MGVLIHFCGCLPGVILWLSWFLAVASEWGVALGRTHRHLAAQTRRGHAPFNSTGKSPLQKFTRQIRHVRNASLSDSSDPRPTRPVVGSSGINTDA
jgi:hypothetical protein